MPSSTSIIAPLANRTPDTTSWVGTTGVRPVSTRNVTTAESRAKPTATGPMSRLASRDDGPPVSAASGRATCSALVMGACGPAEFDASDTQRT